MKYEVHGGRVYLRQGDALRLVKPEAIIALLNGMVGAPS